MKQQTATILAISLLIVVLGLAGCSKDNTSSNCPHYAKAMQGCPWSQIDLSNCLAKGNINYGVIQNSEEAYFWFLIAESNGKELRGTDTDPRLEGVNTRWHHHTANARHGLGLDIEQMRKVQRRAAKDFRKYRRETQTTFETTDKTSQNNVNEDNYYDYIRNLLSIYNLEDLDETKVMQYDKDKFKGALGILERYKDPVIRSTLSGHILTLLNRMAHYIQHYTDRYLEDISLSEPAPREPTETE